MPKVLSQAWEKFFEIHHAQPEDIHELLHKLLEDLQIIKNSSNAIVPILPTEEPDNFLSMGDEHLSTISESESDEVKKSSVENLVPIPSKFEVTSDNEKMPKVLSQAWDKFFKIQHAQPEDSHELIRKLLEDLEIISGELAEYINSLSWDRPDFYNDDDEYYIQYKEYLENYSIAITPVLLTEEPDNSLSMGDEHLSTIPKTESDEVIMSSVENLVPIPSESEVTFDNESECDVLVCDDFTTFSNPLFDSDDDFTSTDDELLSNEDAQMEKFKEFSGELAHIDPIPPGIEEADFDLEEEIRLVENLFNDTLPLPKTESSNFNHHDDPSFPRPPPKPPDVEVFFDFEPDTGILTAKVVEDIYEHHVLMPKFLPSQPTLCPILDPLILFSSENEDKVFKPSILSYLLVSHRDKTIFDFYEDAMMISGGDIPHLDVSYLHFYPP
nr:hypothetical protein [Tanacetum cinerariifolium]